MSKKVTLTDKQAKQVIELTKEVKQLTSRQYELLDEVSDLKRKIIDLTKENRHLATEKTHIHNMYEDLQKKTRGNLGVLVPQLQKERDTWMQAHEGHLKTIEQLRLSNKRLQDIVALWVNGTLR